MGKELKDYNWDEIRDALQQYADHLEKTAPHAVNTINTLRMAAESLPDAAEFE